MNHPAPPSSSSSAGEMLQRMTKYKSRTRTLLELQVGKSHCVEILMQIRRSDIPWFETNVTAIWEEVLELLERSIVPRMCGEEIERYHELKHPEKFPPQVGQKSKRGNPNKGKKSATNTKGTKRKRGKEESLSSKKSVSKDQGDETVPTKADKDVYYAFGDEIQLAYRRTEISKSNSVTLFFKKGDEEEETQPTGSSSATSSNDKETNGTTAATKSKKLHQLHKLSHRIHLWCSKIVDPLQKTNPDLPGIGFYRPELIPMSSLFRQPPEGIEWDDDDDDD